MSPDAQDKISEDLEAWIWQDIDKVDKYRLITKDQMKKILTRSPDDGDTIIMRAYFDVAQESMP